MVKMEKNKGENINNKNNMNNNKKFKNYLS